jgi:hypothetical protein
MKDPSTTGYIGDRSFKELTAHILKMHPGNKGSGTLTEFGPLAFACTADSICSILPTLYPKGNNR